MKGHFGGNARLGSGEEMCVSHSRLEGAKGMLEGLAPDAHGVRIGIEPVLHRLDHIFMLPSGDTPLLARRTARFDRAGLTGAGPVSIYL